MKTYRREFLHKISGAAFLAASPSILGRDGEGPMQENSPPSGKQNPQDMESLRAQSRCWEKGSTDIL